MGASKKNGKKKSGPRGKKARAKAKLDRQWGEVVDEEKQTKSRIRLGKSRLLCDKGQSKSRLEGWKARATDQEVVPDEGEDDASYSTDDRNSQDGALSQLLYSINERNRKAKRKARRQRQTGEFENALVESEVNSQMEEDKDGSDNDSMTTDEDSEPLPSEEDGEFDNRLSDEEDPENDAVDPFSARFNRDPLPEDDEAISKMLVTSQTFSKERTPFLDDSLELRLAGPITDDTVASRSERKWHDRAGSLFRFNRKVLRQNWRKVNKASLRNDAEGASESAAKERVLSSFQCVLYPALASYGDVLVTAESLENRSAVSNVLYLHLLNHVLTTRGRIQRNNKKTKELQESEDNGKFDEEKLRDQGYTRATVLVLLPTRGTCRSFVIEMLKLLGDAARVDNLDRFETEYGPPVIEGDEETDDAKRKRRKAVIDSKGPEWQELFGDETNADDDFKLGMTLTPKAAGLSKKKASAKSEGGVSVKLYSDFYKSDMIIASPLGLKMTLDGDDGEVDADFLSSIEVCVVARSEVLLMQNWDHVNSVLELLNQQPKKNNDTDFSRVRQYLLAGQAKHWRQLILASQLSDPHILSTFKRHAKSITGRLKLKRRTPVESASLCNVIVRSKQVFQRIASSSFANQSKDRLRYFEDNILPKIRRLKQKHTLIFIPSYFDFVSVRNLLLKKEVEFVSVTEYARVSEVSRGRARFLQGRKQIMLYTGRCHFFSHHTIKGARHVIFFGLPEHPKYYSDMVNILNLGLEEAELDAPITSLALFTKYDAHALERIVGSNHCERMIKGEKSTFMFCS